MPWPDLTDTLARAEVRALFNEPSPLVVTDEDIDEWLDRATQELTNLGEASEQNDISFTLVDNKKKYPLSEMSLTANNGIVALIYAGTTDVTKPAAEGYALMKMHPRNFFNIRDNTAGPPTHWTYHNEAIWIWPEPTATQGSIGSHVVSVLYHELVTDTPWNLSSIWENMPIYYALAKCFEKDRKPAQYQQYMSVFNNMISFMRQVIGSYRTPDSNDMMQLPDYTQYE